MTITNEKDLERALAQDTAQREAGVRYTREIEENSSNFRYALSRIANGDAGAEQIARDALNRAGLGWRAPQ